MSLAIGTAISTSRIAVIFLTQLALSEGHREGDLLAAPFVKGGYAPMLLLSLPLILGAPALGVIAGWFMRESRAGRGGFYLWGGSLLLVTLSSVAIMSGMDLVNDFQVVAGMHGILQWWAW